MLKISNKGKKNEQVETITMLDKCTKIMKEDRLILRQLIKEDNVKLLELVAKHKKKTDLTDLQTELRKFLKEKRVESENLQPVLLRKVKSKERTDFGVNIRSPSRSKLDFRKKQQRDESLKRTESVSRQIPESAQKSHRVKEPSKIHTDQDTQDEQQKSSEMTPMKLEFQTIVSQAPMSQTLYQSDQRSECVLQYNAAEIQQYLNNDQNESRYQTQFDLPQQEKHYVSKSAFVMPELVSLNYKTVAPIEYRYMFTDWKEMLTDTEKQYREIYTRCNSDIYM